MPVCRIGHRQAAGGAIISNVALFWTEICRYFSVAERKKLWKLKVAFVLLHQVDILLTSFAISAGFVELNPVIGGLLDSPFRLLIFKLAIPLIIVWIVPARLLLPSLLLLLLVIAFNLTQLSLLL